MSINKYMNESPNHLEQSNNSNHPNHPNQPNRPKRRSQLAAGSFSNAACDPTCSTLPESTPNKSNHSHSWKHFNQVDSFESFGEM